MSANGLPQLDRLFLADGGLETDLIFHHGVDMPCNSSITLLRDERGKRLLENYYRDYVMIAERAKTGVVLDSATWRASADWADPLGLSLEALDRLNAEAIRLLRRVKEDYRGAVPVVISGCVGPRGDGYDPGRIMAMAEAKDYHQRQVAVLAAAGADMISAITMTNVPEAAGIARTAEASGMPAVISFTVETDGRLPTGDALGAAIEAVDEASGGYPAYFMINCAHPSHFRATLEEGGDWIGRVRGIRANASHRSHDELDVMTELDEGDPEALGDDYRALRDRFPQLAVLGGCCGTDHRHIAAIAEACFAPA